MTRGSEAQYDAILAIDPGKVSGWARVAATGWMISGVAMDCKGRLACSGLALNRLLIIAETWTPHGMSNAAAFGLGAEWGKWLQCIEEQGTWKVGRRKYPVIERVQVNVWRRELFGRKRLTREQAKRLALARASAFAARRITDDNEAEAVCILEWAMGKYGLRAMRGEAAR